MSLPLLGRALTAAPSLHPGHPTGNPRRPVPATLQRPTLYNVRGVKFRHDLGEMIRNQVLNLSEDRIAVIQAVFDRP
jgi:hypothetical protein